MNDSLSTQTIVTISFFRKGLPVWYSRRTRIAVSTLALLGLAIICNTPTVMAAENAEVAENAGAAENAEAAEGAAKISGPRAIGPIPTQGPISADELGFDEIVFVKRKPYSSDHYYTDINNGTSPDRFLPENGIYVYNVRTGEERAVVTAADLPGGKGFLGKLSLSFDAQKVLFDFRQDPGSGFRIWEVGIDGSGLRQVSSPPADEPEKVARWHPSWHTDDIHPCYLPDGHVIFSSTRSEHTVLCGGSSHLVAPTLHRMTADGKDVVQLSNSPVSEFCPVILSDGPLWRGRRHDDGLHVSAADSRQRPSPGLRGHVPLSARRMLGSDYAHRHKQRQSCTRSRPG